MVRNVSVSAEDMVRTVDARTTRPRIAVLAALLNAPRALTHHEVVAQVRHGLQVDRVTVYRVLDWLVANHLAHRIAGDDRIWRFNAAAGDHSGEHVHFECNRCGRVTCMDDTVPAPHFALPRGFRRQHVEVTVKGLCAECPQARSRAAHHQ